MVDYLFSFIVGALLGATIFTLIHLYQINRITKVIRTRKSYPNLSDYVSSGIDMEDHLKTCPHLEPQENDDE